MTGRFPAVSSWLPGMARWPTRPRSATATWPASQPMTEDTIFAIASMTKPITCVAVMMLVEQGKLGLDDPVAKYLPELKDMRVLGDAKDDTGDEIATVPAKRPDHDPRPALAYLRFHLRRDARRPTAAWGGATRGQASMTELEDDCRPGCPAGQSAAGPPARGRLDVRAEPRRARPRDRGCLGTEFR